MVDRDIGIVVGVYVEERLWNWNGRNLINRNVFFSLSILVSFFLG